MRKIASLSIIILFISCGISQKVKRNEKAQDKISNEILNKYGNAITLNYGTAIISNILYNDNDGNWKLIKLKNGKGKLININKEPHFIGDSIIVETENELNKINSKIPPVLDGTTIDFKYKSELEIYKIQFFGQIEDFKAQEFELNYLKIIKEILIEENL